MPVPSRMNNSDRIRKLLLQIRDAEQKLDGLRHELRRLVARSGRVRAVLRGRGLRSSGQPKLFALARYRY